jgi:O-antigen ligase
LIRFTGAALLALLAFATLTIWIPARWPASLFEAGVFLLAMLRAPALLKLRHPLLLPLAAAALWPLLQLAAGSTAYRWETWTGAQFWLANLAVFALSLDAFRGRAARSSALHALVYFAFVLALIGTVQSFTSDGKIFWLFPSGYPNFIIGPFVSPNHYAAFVELILPIAVADAVLHRDRRLVYSGMVSSGIAGFLCASVVAGGSRAGSVLVAAEVIAVWLLASRAARAPKRLTAWSLAAVALSAALFTAVVGTGFLLSRFRLADPFTGRREMLLASLQMIRDHPWLGVGLGNWPSFYPAYAVYDDGLLANQADNDWIQWAAEGGLPFALILLPLPVWAFRRGLALPWAAGPFFFFLHCLADYPSRKPALAGLLFLLMACAASETSVGQSGSDPA